MLGLSVAAAIAAAAAVASGVVAGPPPRPLAVTDHLATAAAAGLRKPAVAAHGASLLGGYASSVGTDPVIAAGSAHPAHRRGARHAGPAGGKATQATRTSPAGSRPATSHPSAAPAQTAAPEQPLQFYDSTTPAAAPAGAIVATYATGHYAVPASAAAGRPIIWIDAWGTDPAASVLDVEPGDATPAMAATWVAEKLTQDPTARARLYTMVAEWPAVKQAVSGLPSWMEARIRWWIADPTGVPHMVAGANATQWYWGPNYDISTADPGF